MDAAPPEAVSLLSSMQALETSGTTSAARAREARAVQRLADDLEVTATEAATADARAALMSHVRSARAAATSARAQARQQARVAGRADLLASSRASPPRPDKGHAAGLAAEINASLRRATAVVAGEVSRADAAGHVVDESSRRLKMTRDQHAQYGDKLGDGAGTLRELRRVDFVANLAVGVSFLLFFFVAAYVARKRVVESNTATFLVRPAFRVILAPVRAVGGVLAFAFGSAAVPEGGQGNSVVDAGGGKESAPTIGGATGVEKLEPAASAADEQVAAELNASGEASKTYSAETTQNTPSDVQKTAGDVQMLGEGEDAVVLMAEDKLSKAAEQIELGLAAHDEEASSLKGDSVSSELHPVTTDDKSTLEIEDIPAAQVEMERELELTAEKGAKDVFDDTGSSILSDDSDGAADAAGDVSEQGLGHAEEHAHTEREEL